MNRVPLKIQVILRICAAMLLVAAMSAIAAAEVSLELALDRDHAYPGEMVPVTVTLRIGNETVRNIGYPRLASSEGGTVAFAPPVQVADDSNPNSTLYRFSGRISGVKPGQLAVGPTTLNLEVMEHAGARSAFFGTAEPRLQSLVSAPLSLTILPLPAAGRPPSFSGAIGTFSMTVNAKPAAISVGDPLTITTTISGTGSLDHAGCPQVTGNDLRSYPPTAMHRDRGLVCEQVVVPNTAGEVPPVVWSYFDPGQRRYRTVRQPLPAVAPPPSKKENTVPVAVSAAVVPSSILPLFQSRSLLAWLAAMFAFALAAYTTRTVWRHYGSVPHKTVAATPPEFRQFLVQLEQALAEHNVEKFYTLFFSTLQHIPGTAGDVAIPAVTGVLPDSSVGLSPLSDQLFDRCNRVRFGRFIPRHDDMQSDLILLRSLLRSLGLLPS